VGYSVVVGKHATTVLPNAFNQRNFFFLHGSERPLASTGERRQVPDMIRLRARRALRGLVTVAMMAVGTAATAENPIVPGWYADPEIRQFAGNYWIYPTVSEVPANAPAPVLSVQQKAMRARRKDEPGFLAATYLDAFSSPDLMHWTKHPHILSTAVVAWAAFAIWAPSVVQADGRYFLFFSANDIHQGDLGGIGVAVGDGPAGPFRDYLGKPLIGDIQNGAQPIDPMVFRDDDGQFYLYYGGWGHLNVVRLKSDMTQLEPFADGTTFKEITPGGYREGSFMIKRRGIYYLMWSEGDWTGPNYQIAYATGPSAIGPFSEKGVILASDEHVARGAGHHSVVNEPGTDKWWIAYHRRPSSETDEGHRVLAIDRLEFKPDGEIKAVRMTGR
jgi:hypothetical protein